MRYPTFVYKLVKKYDTLPLISQILELRAARNTIYFQKMSIEKLRDQVYHAPVVRAMAEGKSFEEAVVEYARDVDPDSRLLARSFVQVLTENPATKDAGCVGFAVILWKLELYESAYHYFREVESKKAQDLAPFEYFDSLFFVDQAAGLNEITEYLNRHRADLSAQTKLSLLKVLAKFRALDLLRTETKALLADKAALSSLSEEDCDLVVWFNKHLNHEEPDAKDIPGAINIAVMDYKLLDKSRTSRNRGDYVQTLAALSNLLRFQNIEYVGNTKLSNYLNKLKNDIKPERRLDGPAVKVQPIAIDRDFSSGREYPENTWLISNGWFMHRNFKGPVDFPYPKNVKPLMVSFHIQDVDVLTEETVAELKRIEPIGCRDWTTLYRLRDYGVKAFFSGCVTTTVGQVLPAATGTSSNKLAHVEGKLDKTKYGGWKIDQFIQVGEQVRDFDLVEGIEDARAMLAEYADYKAVSTSRLHCYLPARSMGLKVDFHPKNLADVRFEGLINLDDAAFNKIRNGIEDKLEVTLKAILEGKNEAEVRKIWADICQAEVDFAEKYATTYTKSTESNIDVPAAVATLEKSKVTVGNNPRGKDAVDVALALDQNLEKMIPVVIQSLVDHTTRPINAHILTRGLGKEFRDRMGKLFPEINFSFYAFDDVDYGDSIALLAHISVSTMDRLFLPELLKDLDKVVYLDIDILIQGDVGYLYDLELGENVFAGKRTRLKTWASMIRPITRATLHFEPQKAWDIRRRLHDQADLTARTFNAGILSLNLKLMREENFTKEHLYLVEQCRMNDQDVFNIYSKGRVLEIGTEWNHVPSQDFNNDPKIIHWAGPAKPWKKEFVLLKPRFEATQAKVESRL
ncbi:MAG: glycosyltransferase family 8 protein [Micrococcales bacterium]|nr:glycosyltransferase family 8 protein [Micrococcales bacterium]